MTMGEAVAKRIDEYLYARQWSLYRLSRESYLPLSTLKNLYNGHTKSPSLTVIFKIAEAFGVTPLEFLDCDVFKSEDLEID